MKRGFEENVPKVRPRVRLGRALDEQYAEAQEAGASESVAPPIAPAIHEPAVHEVERAPVLAAVPADSGRSAVTPDFGRSAVTPDFGRSAAPPDFDRSAVLADVRRRAAAAAEPLTEAPPAESVAPKRRRASAAAAEVADLARELTTELSRAAEANARLKSDLDAALNALRQAADESREQRFQVRRDDGKDGQGGANAGNPRSPFHPAAWARAN